MYRILPVMVLNYITFNFIDYFLCGHISTFVRLEDLHEKIVMETMGMVLYC